MSVWPVDYREQLASAACSLCAEGWPEEIGGRRSDHDNCFDQATTDAWLTAEEKTAILFPTLVVSCRVWRKSC